MALIVFCMSYCKTIYRGYANKVSLLLHHFLYNMFVEGVLFNSIDFVTNY